MRVLTVAAALLAGLLSGAVAEPVIALLNKEFARILAQPETRQRLLQIGIEPVGGTPASLGEFEKKERTKWGPLIKAAGLKGE